MKINRIFSEFNQITINYVNKTALPHISSSEILRLRCNNAIIIDKENLKDFYGRIFGDHKFPWSHIWRP